MLATRLKNPGVDFIKSNAIAFSYAIIAVLLMAVCTASIWQGSYNVDPHHWGLMMSNAQDLAQGKTPYKDIFIQYGILTTIIQAVGLELFGNNLQSIITTTSIAYAIGLLGIYQISYQVSASRKTALFTFITCVLVHGIVIYPWSNYIAFPFLTYGVLYAIIDRPQRRYVLFSGILLGMAILCREGLFPAVLMTVALVSIKEMVTNDSKKLSAERLVALWIGLSTPLLAFFGYLLIEDLLNYWKITAFDLPKIYAHMFFPNGVMHSALELVKFFIIQALQLDLRFIFFCLLIAALGISLILFLWKSSYFYKRWDVLILSTTSLLLLSSALHITEVFRLSTGTALGAVVLYLIAKMLKVETLVFLVLCGLLTTTLARSGMGTGSNGNYFLPTREQIDTATTNQSIEQFSGQRWPQAVFDYYINFKSEVQSIAQSGCGVQYQYNDSKDAYLALISPFTPYQVAPFGRGLFTMPSWEYLRPDIDIQKKIRDDHDIVIFYEASEDNIDSYVPPAGYFLRKVLKTPKSFFFSTPGYLLIVAPIACSPTKD